MHRIDVNVHFTVTDAVTSGAGWGAVGALIGLLLTAGRYLPFIAILALAGKADISKRRLVAFGLLYAGVGAVIGGYVAHLGHPYWASAAVALAISTIPYIIGRIIDKRRGY
jgi:hypothetical protein